MTNHTQQIVNTAWSYAHVLRDFGLSYMAYTGEITFLSFSRWPTNRPRPPYNHAPINFTDIRVRALRAAPPNRGKAMTE